MFTLRWDSSCWARRVRKCKKEKLEEWENLVVAKVCTRLNKWVCVSVWISSKVCEKEVRRKVSCRSRSRRGKKWENRGKDDKLATKNDEGDDNDNENNEDDDEDNDGSVLCVSVCVLCEGENKLNHWDPKTRNRNVLSWFGEEINWKIADRFVLIFLLLATTPSTPVSEYECLLLKWLRQLLLH